MSTGAIIGITTVAAGLALATAALAIGRYWPELADRIEARALLALDRLRRRIPDPEPPTLAEYLADAADIWRTNERPIDAIRVHDRADFLRVAQAAPADTSLDYFTGARALLGCPVYVDPKVPPGVVIFTYSGEGAAELEVRLP